MLVRYWGSDMVSSDSLCPSQVQYVQAPSFGYRPVKMTCPHCQASITTKTEEEASAMAWILCGACCLFGFWPCACIPFCVDSLQAVSQQSRVLTGSLCLCLSLLEHGKIIGDISGDSQMSKLQNDSWTIQRWPLKQQFIP